MAIYGDGARLRRLIPLATVGLALTADLISIPGFEPVVMMPHMTLPVLFYWSLIRPTLMTGAVIFGSGLVLDLIAGLPIGLSSLSMLLAIKLLTWTEQAFIAGSFVVMWGCFVLTAIMMFVLRWILACLWWGHLFSVEKAMIEAAMTIAVFPAIHWLGGLVEVKVPRE